MNTSTKSNTAPGCSKPVIAIIIVVIAGILMGTRSCRNNRRQREKEMPTFEVRRGPLTISIKEAGSIENREKVVVYSKVESHVQIVWLVEEGKSVKKGELLVELDATSFTDKRIEQEICLQNTQASFIRAQEELEVTRNQTQSDVEKAELELKFAGLDLEKYLKGEYPQQLKAAEADITIAKEEVNKATDNLAWSAKLEDKGHITRNELLADELAIKRANINLALAEGRLDLLKKYTHGQQVEKLKSDAKQAKMALQRERRKSKANIVQAEADLRARESEYHSQKGKLEKIVKNIKNCRILAPSEGMVVYATSGHRWRRDGPLEKGQEVAKRQELIHLPTTSAMIAKMTIHESSVTKVRKRLPLHVRITIDALPGREFEGTLTKISVLPDTSRAWLNPELKVYNCRVDIKDESTKGEIRPGMSCGCEIIIEEYDDALYVPVQSVMLIDGQPTAYRVGLTGKPKPVEVHTGLDNNRHLRITGGLKKGDKVLLAPPLPPSGAKPRNTEKDKDPARKKERSRRGKSDSSNH